MILASLLLDALYIINKWLKNVNFKKVQLKTIIKNHKRRLNNNLYNDKITKPTLSKNVSAIILLNNLTLSNKKAIKHQI